MNARTVTDWLRASQARETSTIPLTFLALLFLAGDLLLLTRPDVRACAILLALLLNATAWFAWNRGAAWIALGCMTAGAVHAWLAVSQQLELRWPESRAGERARAQVVIDSVPVAGPLGWSFDAFVQVEAPQPLPGFRAHLLWNDHAARPRSGERWQLVISLRPPRAPLNPSGVDRELLYFRERIHAVGTVVDSHLNDRIDAGHRPLTALREHISDRIRERVSDRDAAALIAALAVGVVGEMSREQWRVFNATGTTHLVAISGLHVTLFALIALHAARLIWRFGVWRVAHMPRELFAAFTAISAATAYSLLAGFSVPTQRTLVMLAVWLLVRSSARACSPFSPLSIALVVVLILDPFAPLAAGFWLSFGAISAIILVTHGRCARQSTLREAATVQASVSLTLAPFTLAWFSGASLAGLVVNAAAIPLISFLFVPLVLMAVVLMPLGESAFGPLLDGAGWLYAMGWPWLVAAADSPIALVYASPPRWWYAAAIAVAVVALMPWPMRLRVASVAWLVPVAAAGATSPKAGELDLTLLDVGRGTAAVLRTAGHVLVYETGDVWGSGGGAAERALVPFLRGEGTRRIDRVVISRVRTHGSPGLTTLLASFPVEIVLMGGLGTDLHHARPCIEGEAWRWDGVLFEILHPPAIKPSAEGSQTVTPSCVLRVTGPGGSVLLPGDLDAEGEHQLVQSGLGPVDVVVIPRNGSNSASSPELIAATRARWALVSGERHGRSRGEKPAVGRWHHSGAKVLVTGDSGAIRLTIDPVQGARRPLGQRDTRPSLWRVSPRDSVYGRRE